MLLSLERLWKSIEPHEEFWQGKKPTGIAAALIYKAAAAAGSSRTQSEVCNVANVSEVTLRGLLRTIDELFGLLGIEIE